ncbi:MAG: hypothetical protein HQL20_10090 [Candidatus Omnitrophica bacterium]|nr:hypothetical protein [Candidatus Omnitrophota bacterium]
MRINAPDPIMRCVSAFTLICFTLSSSLGYGQSVSVLPAPGTMVPFSSAFEPSILRGLKLDPSDPFQFNFIIDLGGSGDKHNTIDAAESGQLVKYFFTALTVSNDDLWVTH